MKSYNRGPILGTVLGTIGTFFGGLLMLKMGHISGDSDFLIVTGWFVTVISAITTLAIIGWAFFHDRERRHDQNSYMGVVDKINSTYRTPTKEGDDDSR